MDGDSWLDSKELHRAVINAEVLTIFFPLVRKSLIIDTRFSAEDEPLVCLAPHAGSLEGRYRSICRMRPQFPRPQNITAIPGPKYISSLTQSGVVEWIRNHLGQLGFQGPIRALDEAVEELQRLEKLELAAIVQGERYRTIWPIRK